MGNKYYMPEMIKINTKHTADDICNGARCGCDFEDQCEGCMLNVTDWSEEREAAFKEWLANSVNTGANSNQELI